MGRKLHVIIRKTMSDELNSLHSEILSEFERRLKDDEEIPNAIVTALQDEEDLGLKSTEIVKTAIETEIIDEIE